MIEIMYTPPSLAKTSTLEDSKTCHPFQSLYKCSTIYVISLSNTLPRKTWAMQKKKIGHMKVQELKNKMWTHEGP